MITRPNNKDVDQISEEFFDSLAQFVDSIGYNELTGKIYALSIIYDKQITQQDFVKLLDSSPPTVSRILKRMEEEGRMLQKKKKPGTNIWQYGLSNISFYNFFTSFMKTRLILHDELLEKFEINLDTIEQYPADIKELPIVVNIRDRYEELINSIKIVNLEFKEALKRIRIKTYPTGKFRTTKD